MRYELKKQILNSKLKITIYESLVKRKGLSKKELYLYSFILSAIKTLRRNNLSTQSIESDLIFNQLHRIGYNRPKEQFKETITSLVSKRYFKFNNSYFTLPCNINNMLNGQAKDYKLVKYKSFSKLLIDLMYSKDLALKANKKTKQSGVLSFTNQTKVANTLGCDRSTIANSVKGKNLFYAYAKVGSFTSKKSAIQFKKAIQVQEAGKYIILKASSGSFCVYRLTGSKKVSGGEYHVKNGRKVRIKRYYQSNTKLRELFVRQKASEQTTIIESFDFRNNTDYIYCNKYLLKDIL